MTRGQWLIAAVFFVLCLLSISCSSDPESPATTSSVSGTVVYAATGAPAAGVDVVMEQCAGTGTGHMMDDSMMRADWDHARHMATDEHGQFHFDYMHEQEHRYRVRAGSMDPDGMCYLDAGAENGIVLRVEGQ